VDGFYVKFENKTAFSTRYGFLESIYFRSGSFELCDSACITVPSGLNTDKLQAAGNYFYGQLEKKQAAEKRRREFGHPRGKGVPCP